LRSNLTNSQPVPGPPVYKGEHNAPTGPQPTMTPEKLGAFPPAFDTKYRSLLAKLNAWSDKAVVFFDTNQGGMNFITTHQQEATQLTNERARLRQEAISLGLANANVKMQNSKIFKRAESMAPPMK
jgi:hypothetical protein